MTSYFWVLDGGIDHLCMKKRLLELEVLKIERERKIVQVRFITDIFTHEVTIPRKECSIVYFLFFTDALHTIPKTTLSHLKLNKRIYFFYLVLKFLDFPIFIYFLS